MFILGLLCVVSMLVHVIVSAVLMTACPCCHALWLVLCWCWHVPIVMHCCWCHHVPAIAHCYLCHVAVSLSLHIVVCATLLSMLCWCHCIPVFTCHCQCHVNAAVSPLLSDAYPLSHVIVGAMSMLLCPHWHTSLVVAHILNINKGISRR
jgi:hypothetical protein